MFEVLVHSFGLQHKQNSEQPGGLQVARPSRVRHRERVVSADRFCVAADKQCNLQVM